VGAVATAAFLFHRDKLPQTKMNVAVISGGNIEPELPGADSCEDLVNLHASMIRNIFLLPLHFFFFTVAASAA